jgi:hypothetical protein
VHCDLRTLLQLVEIYLIYTFCPSTIVFDFKNSPTNSNNCKMSSEKRAAQPSNSQARRTPSQSQSSSSQQRPQNDDDDLPPGYSMAAPPPDPAQLRNAALGRMIPGIVPNINFAAYAPLGSEVSTDLTTTTIVNAALCSSPQAFAKTLAEQVALPPVPEVRIRGTHMKWGVEEVDFDIRLNMMRYFVPKDGSNNLHYTQMVSSGKTAITNFSIEEMARSFCGSTASDKR